MKLVDIYERPIALAVLYALLKERTPEQSISHREMPTFEQHEDYVSCRPHPHWYLIEADGAYVGSIYLSDNDEIGVFLFARCQHEGYGRRAVELLIQAHPRERYLANINPENQRSIGFFGKLGFHHIQSTYELRP